MIPQVKLTIKDGNAGPVPSALGVHAKIGIATQGPTNTLMMFTDAQLLRDTFGGGPAVEAADYALLCGVGQVGIVRAAQSAAGTAGAVTQVGSGTGTIAVTGAPLDAYNVVVKIITGGAVGTAAYAVSLDGGDTYGDTTATASTVAVSGTGFTLGFTGTFVAGDTYSFATAAPATNSAGMLAALNAALVSPQVFEFVHIVGTAATVAGQVALVQAASAAIHSARGIGRHTFALFDCPADTDANILAEMTPVIAPWVSIGAGFAEIVTRKGALEDRPASWVLATKLAMTRFSEDVGHVGAGPLPNVSKMRRDEQATPAFHDARIGSLRSIVGRRGVYATSVQSLAPITSDYRFIDAARVINVASDVVLNTLTLSLNAKVRVEPQSADFPGAIVEADAANLEAVARGALSDALLQRPDVTAVGVTVNRQTNVASTNTLYVNVWVVLLATLRRIEVTLGILVPRSNLREDLSYANQSATID